MKKLRNIVVNLLIYGALLLLWERFSPETIPAPSLILQRLWEILPKITDDFAYTMMEAVAGFAAGVAAALLVVTLMDLSATVKSAVAPVIVLSQSIPFNVVAPILIMALGIGLLPKILVVSLVCFFPLALTLLSSFDNVDKSLLEVASLFGANRLQTVRYLKFPMAVPGFFAGCKIGAVYCLSSALIAEWMVGDAGLGAYMLRAKRSYNGAAVFAVILIIVALSMAVYYLLQYVERQCKARLEQ